MSITLTETQTALLKGAALDRDAASRRAAFHRVDAELHAEAIANAVAALPKDKRCLAMTDREYREYKRNARHALCGLPA